jgi:phosphoadenosine phosphosulfate reductase
MITATLAGEALASALAEATNLGARLRQVCAAIPGRIVFTTSFGLEDQALAHAIFSTDLSIDVLTLDTGRLFPETYELWAETETRYRRRILAYAPHTEALESLVSVQGINGFRNSVEARQACCAVRKVHPLGRALAGAAGWVTGLRAEQSAQRAAIPLAAPDGTYGVIKINPLADWSRAEVAAYVARHAVPYNPLHDRGFPSIGCAPCTRAIQAGEPERAGRWWWENETKKECGLLLRPTASAANYAEAQ